MFVELEANVYFVLLIALFWVYYGGLVCLSVCFRKAELEIWCLIVGDSSF